MYSLVNLNLTTYLHLAFPPKIEGFFMGGTVDRVKRGRLLAIARNSKSKLPLNYFKLQTFTCYLKFLKIYLYIKQMYNFIYLL